MNLVGKLLKVQWQHMLFKKKNLQANYCEGGSF